MQRGFAAGAEPEGEPPVADVAGAPLKDNGSWERDGKEPQLQATADGSGQKSVEKWCTLTRRQVVQLAR